MLLMFGRPPGWPEIFMFLIIIPLIVVYLLPTIIVLIRKNVNKSMVILLNVFLGWTLVGWIISLILSLQNQQKNPDAKDTLQ